MRIAEMESHHSAYLELEARISSMVRNTEFPDVFSACETSFEHIVGAINYRKRREIEPAVFSPMAFSVIYEYAPALFEHATIESFFNFVKTTRVIARHENDYLQWAVVAFECEDIARSLWNYLEQHPGALQQEMSSELGIDEEIWITIVTIWEKLGLISRKPDNGSDRWHLQIRLNETAEGMCQTCGIHGKGRKELFFKPISCRNCGAEDYYHLVCSERE